MAVLVRQTPEAFVQQAAENLKSFEFQRRLVRVHQFPCPHPSTLTWISLTMETFSPRVRGRL